MATASEERRARSLPMPGSGTKEEEVVEEAAKRRRQSHSTAASPSKSRHAYIDTLRSPPRSYKHEKTKKKAPNSKTPTDNRHTETLDEAWQLTSIHWFQQTRHLVDFIVVHAPQIDYIRTRGGGGRGPYPTREPFHVSLDLLLGRTTPTKLGMLMHLNTPQRMEAHARRLLRTIGGTTGRRANGSKKNQVYLYEQLTDLYVMWVIQQYTLFNALVVKFISETISDKDSLLHWEIYGRHYDEERASLRGWSDGLLQLRGSSSQQQQSHHHRARCPPQVVILDTYLMWFWRTFNVRQKLHPKVDRRRVWSGVRNYLCGGGEEESDKHEKRSHRHPHNRRSGNTTARRK